MLISFNRESNAESVLSQLIESLNVRVTKNSVHKCLLEHPEYPSLLSYTDCLNEWNISNQAYKIDKTQFDPNIFHYPFIAHISIPKDSFLLVKEISNGVVKCSNEDGDSSFSEKDFLLKWNGIFLTAVVNENSGEENYKSARFAELLAYLKIPFIFVLAVTLMLFGLYNHHISLWNILLLIVKLFGVIISILLLTQSIDDTNPFVQNLCTIGKKSNCNTVLNSESAKITNWLSWSEIGLFYFLGSFLAFLFFPNLINDLAILNICTLPYTIYSITFQYKLKTWCIMCCAIQLLLWSEFSIYFISHDYKIVSLPFLDIVGLLFCFLLPVVLWYLIKTPLQNSVQTSLLTQQLNKFKYNIENFNHMLLTVPQTNVPDDLCPVVLGDRNSNNVITIISNPYCNPCVAAHKSIVKLLNQREDLQVKMIFITAEFPNGPKIRVMRHFAALNSLNDKSIVEMAINDWYESTMRDYDSWTNKFPVDIGENSNLIVSKQRNWCESMGIMATPTILINGSKLPLLYALEDLKYLLN